MTDLDLPTPEPEPKKNGLSWVWLMPVLAVLIAAGMVWQTYANRGPLITVSFPSANGIEAGQTPLRFRELEVGRVESADFAEGLAAIEVHIRLDKKIAPYVDDKAQFWLVQPRVSARGVTGLTTVLSGVYIEGSWDGVPTGAQSHYTALPEAPLFSPGEAGTRVVLRSRSGGQLTGGAPVLFNGIEAGWIGNPVLSDSGLVVTRDAFIKAPYDQRLSTATRFWDSSGLSLDIGTSGITFSLDSLATLVEGGVSFGTLVTGGDSIADGHVYDVFTSMKAARADALEGSGTKLPVAVLVAPDVAGLATGTPVRFGQANVGEVIDVTGYRDPQSAKMQLMVTLEIIPERLGVAPGLSGDEQIAALSKLVAAGLRLRLASEGILGQTTILEFTQLTDAPAAEITTGTTPFPLLPTALARTNDTAEGVDGLVTRIGNLPIEELMTSAIAALDSVKELASRPDVAALPGNANGLIADARALVGSEELQSALTDFQGATADLRALTAEIRKSPGLAALLTALESSGDISAGLAAFSEKLPALTDNVSAVTESFGKVPLSELTASLDALAAQLTTLLGDEGVSDLPEAIVGTLDELKVTLAELRAGGAVENLNKTLAAAQSSLEAIETATKQMPEVVSRLDEAVGTLKSAVAGYAPGSRVQVELTTAIRDISEAAAAFRSLARSIERNPNSLITGR